MTADISPTPSVQTQTQSLSPQEPALSDLLSHCHTHQIHISPSISARHTPNSGLGVYTTRPVKKGEKLIHVPTKAMLTVQNVPESFLSKFVRKKFTVHGALAAFLAFGPEEVVGRYQGWIGTWPRVEEFVEKMPVFWGEDFRQPGNTERDGQDKGDVDERAGGVRANKRRKTIGDDGIDTTPVPMPASTSTTPRFSRSPGIDDFWLTVPTPSPASVAASSGPNTSNQLTTQANKIRACIDMIDKYLPDLQIRSASSHAHYLRFLHMWSCVNTRCFYYLRPGQAPPSDSNEAMALCPFQDLFNHSSSYGKECGGSFDKRGFFVRADRDYEEGEELFLKYGRHGNDGLWAEYGFFPDGLENRDDEVKIHEGIVLEEVDEIRRGMLEREGYLADYTLGRDGVCYRTVVVSYLGMLSDEQWKQMVGGGFDPEGHKNTAFTMVKLRAKRRIVDWVLKVRAEAERNLEVLLSELRGEDDLVAAFVGGEGEASLTEEQRGSWDKKVELARSRREMCVRRWRQVFDMCMGAVRVVERECPGAFVVEGQEGRRSEDLRLDAAQFVEEMGKPCDRQG